MKWRLSQMRTIEVMVSGFIPWYERLEEFCVDVDVPAYLAYANSFSKISYISLWATQDLLTTVGGTRLADHKAFILLGDVRSCDKIKRKLWKFFFFFFSLRNIINVVITLTRSKKISYNYKIFSRNN